MTYFESAEDLYITKARALKEISKHGIKSESEISDFYDDLGDHETYDAQAVLSWLGY